MMTPLRDELNTQPLDKFKTIQNHAELKTLRNGVSEPLLRGMVEHYTSIVSQEKFGNKTFTPSAVDILLGRGRPFQTHAGNQFMLQMVDEFRDKYHACERKGKHLIIEQVLRAISNRGGRFLVHVDFEEYWVEVKRSIAYRKVGHAFRSKARQSSKNGVSISSSVEAMLPSGTPSHVIRECSLDEMTVRLPVLAGPGLPPGAMSSTTKFTLTPTRRAAIDMMPRLPMSLTQHNLSPEEVLPFTNPSNGLSGVSLLGLRYSQYPLAACNIRFLRQMAAAENSAFRSSSSTWSEMLLFREMRTRSIAQTRVQYPSGFPSWW